ncbi:hypothetical protein [Streptomyces sp. NPDC051452]|uniref:hypothetical protein n=1 Tax=Streptomyces sp. NPDC051452 TaxID=3365654 RepID=UPI0037B89D2C
MTNTPPRPDYPPYSTGWADPETHVHVHLTNDEPQEDRWDFSWLQVGRNTKAIVVSIVTSPWWAAALRDVHKEQGMAGAWFMGWAVMGGAIFFDHARQRFLTRVLLWTAVLGAVEALPVFSELVHLLTGSHS